MSLIAPALKHHFAKTEEYGTISVNGYGLQGTS